MMEHNVTILCDKMSILRLVTYYIFNLFDNDMKFLARHSRPK